MARYPAYRKRRSNRTTWLVLCLVLVGVSVGLWAAFGRGGDEAEGAGNVTRPAKNSGPPTRPTNPSAGTRRDRRLKPTSRQADPNDPRRRQARKELQAGLRYREDKKIIEARTVMSKALLSGLLSPADQKRAVEHLTKIADKTILSRSIDSSDPYAQLYRMLPGDVLEKVVRKLKLRIPWRVILKINRRAWQGPQGNHSARRIRAGEVLKVIRGPCHAIVYKSDRVMDLYLEREREKLPPVFLRRISVGLGRYGSTPLGVWKVRSRLTHATYYPAANSKHKAPIEYGRPDYPLGVKGLWIGLEGIDEKTRSMVSYGIHSTDKQGSIGSDQSEGCIRVSDKDIDLVFAILAENCSKVDIRP